VFVDGANANDATWSTNHPGGQYVITANNAYREMEAANPGYGTTIRRILCRSPGRYLHGLAVAQC
jgi:hypothetical protein